MTNLSRLIESMDEDYFDKLPADMQETARLFLDRFGSDYQIEQVECRRRDGFIPHSWNKGGLEMTVSYDLSYFFGGGYSVGIPEAQKVIDKYTDISLKYANEEFLEKRAELLSDLGVLNDQVNYHDLYKLGFGSLAEELSEFESENMSGENGSTYHSVRLIYSGQGAWTIAVLHRISDAPYHRTCDGFREWKFKALTAKQLKANLNKLEKKITETFV